MSWPIPPGGIPYIGNDPHLPEIRRKFQQRAVDDTIDARFEATAEDYDDEC